MNIEKLKNAEWKDEGKIMLFASYCEYYNVKHVIYLIKVWTRIMGDKVDYIRQFRHETSILLKENTDLMLEVAKEFGFKGKIFDYEKAWNYLFSVEKMGKIIDDKYFFKKKLTE